MQWHLIWIDVLESSYIWFGVIAFIIVFALGLTSTNASKRWLGVYWKKLHRLIYIAIVAAVIHYFWQLKGNLADPFMYAIFTVILLGFRVLIWYGNQRLSKMMIPKGREE
jgi:sulfoxide reductase heme-binding subunit YedZ